MLQGAPMRRDGENDKCPGIYQTEDVLILRDFRKKDEAVISPKDALDIARRENIELDTQTKRKDRIPLEDIEEINREVYGNVCGLLKSSVGKLLTEDAVTDMLAQFRDIGAKIRDKADAGPDL